MIQFLPKFISKAAAIPRNYFLIPWTMVRTMKQRSSGLDFSVCEIVTKDGRELSISFASSLKSDIRD